MYLNYLLNGASIEDAVNRVVEGIKAHDLQFDSIAFRGVSGALVAPGVAAKLHKNLLVVRKNETRHSMLTVEWKDLASKYIIVDDFIASGETIRVIIEEVEASALRSYNGKPECVGVLLYDAPTPKGYLPACLTGLNVIGVEKRRNDYSW